jgi:pyruvate/2-oxoglutarate dehydrogenase complex dihydrolipoamide dehydrogenase (E3) component
LGQLFRDFGSQVTLAQRGDRLLRSYDHEIADTVAGILHKQGIQLVTGAMFVRAAQSNASSYMSATLIKSSRAVIFSDNWLGPSSLCGGFPDLFLATVRVRAGR